MNVKNTVYRFRDFFLILLIFTMAPILLNAAPASTGNPAQTIVLSPQHSPDRVQQQLEIDAQLRPRTGATSLPATQPPLQVIEIRLNRLEGRLDSEIKTAQLRFDTMTNSTERAFNILIWVGAIIGVMGTILGSVVIIITWMRERRQHADYEHERKFYENRAEKSGTLEAEAIRGEITNIDKINSVIGLIETVYEKQQKREEELVYVKTTLKELGDKLSGVTGHFDKQYKEVAYSILAFENLSRLDWTQLNSNEANKANRARAIFEILPETALRDNESKRPLQHGRMLQLLGVSAYYANDVESALKYLEKAKKIFTSDCPKEYLYPYAFCLHFLGIIDKNWKHTSRNIGSSLKGAYDFLKEADDLLKHETDEFLTPLTYGEVCSYLSSYKQEAVDKIDNIITKLEERKSKKRLDDNQSALLTRAYLIRGNIYYNKGDWEFSTRLYDKAIAHSKNHFAYLSKALVTSDKKRRKQQFQEALIFLERSDALKKAEVTVRLTSIAWALIASHEVGDKEKIKKYTDELEKVGKNIRTVENRDPLFFSPLSKSPVVYDNLKQAVSEHMFSTVAETV